MPIVWVQRILYRWEFQMIQYISGFRGGEADAPPPSGIPPPADPKGPPFELFSDIHFWLTELKIFSKGAFGANLY